MYVTMSVNSSSSADLPLLPPQLTSSNSSVYPIENECFRSKESISVFAALSITNLLLLPLFIFILYLQYKQWRKQRSAATTQSDVFVYHSIAMQLNSVVGWTLFFCGGYKNLQEVSSLGFCIWTVTGIGKGVFHVLVCVERYLAVVKPITYRGLRPAGRVRVRNISIGCTWLLCFGWVAKFYLLSREINLIVYFCVMSCLLTVMCFCSLSVLCALRRPGPGGEGGNRVRVDQSKKRAFYTIMTIMGVILFTFGGNMIKNITHSTSLLHFDDHCVSVVCSVWLDLPSSLMLPLLFLHRAAKRRRRKQTTESVTDRC